MNRNISLKELIFIAVLLVAVIYYFAFHIPVTNRMDVIATQQSELDSELEIATVQVQTKHQMLKALEKLEKSGLKAVKMPEYNNIDRMLVELNSIMEGTTDYSITFSDATAVDNIARRNIKISFSVPSYDAVVSKIKKINSSKNRYLITDMDLTRGINNEIIMGNTNAFVTANLTITSFEYVSPNGEQPPVDEAASKEEAAKQLALVQAEQEQEQ